MYFLPLHGTAFIVTGVPLWQAANIAQHFHHQDPFQGVRNIAWN